MIDFDNQTPSELSLELFTPIASFLNAPSLELLIINNATMQEINQQTRDIDKPTDVLSFPLEVFQKEDPIGSILISIDKAKELSMELGHSLEDELKLLFTHGLLHLLGFDHECDEGEMRAKELEVIEHFKLPKSLIIRTQES